MSPDSAVALFLLRLVDGRHGLLPGARHCQAAQALGRRELRRAGQRRRRCLDGLGLDSAQKLDKYDMN